MRRHLWIAAPPLILALILALFGIDPAHAAPNWPERQITIIVPFAAGGGTDVATRAVAEVMGKQLGATFVIENRAGANSFIGAQDAARAAPDGYTFFMTSLTTHSINPFLYKKLPYSVGDFAPVGFLVGTSPVLFTAASNPVGDAKSIVAQATSKAGGLNFAVPNASSRFATAMFALQTKAPIEPINFNSTPQAHTEVASGRIDYVFGDFTAGAGLFDAHKLKAIAVAGPRRIGTHPEIPTLAEQGVPGVEVDIWTGLFAPKGTSPQVIERLNAALNKSLDDPSVQGVFRRGNQDSRKMTPAEFGAYVDAQYQHWGAMAHALNIQPE